MRREYRRTPLAPAFMARALLAPRRAGLHGEPAPLTAEESALMRRHPEIGDSLCAPLQSLRSVRPIILGHHERLDGSGYPNGLRGDEVPLEAWVLSLAEDFDMYWTELYGSAIDEVVAGFYEERARKHHPTVVDALSGLVDSGRLQVLMQSNA